MKMKDKEIKIVDDGLVSDFAYELVEEALGIDIGFISNKSEIDDFGRGREEEFKRIEKHYNISMKEFNDESLIYKIADYVFNQIDKKIVGDK